MTDVQPFCSTHTRIALGLRVSASKIHGRGLFASSRGTGFRTEDWIAPLIGEILDPGEFKRRYGSSKTDTAPYVVKMEDDVGNTYYVDGACRRGVGHMANTWMDRVSGKSMPSKCNCVIDKKDDGWPWLRATRTIYPGDEIIADYGEEFVINTQSNLSQHSEDERESEGDARVDYSEPEGDDEVALCPDDDPYLYTETEEEND